MILVKIALYEIAYYGPWWLAFIGVTFCAARYAGWIGVLLSPIVIAGTIVILDIRWIFDEMRHHPENGRDADLIFWVGMLCRILLFSSLLLPFSLLGFWRRQIAKRKKAPIDTANAGVEP